MTDFDDRNDWKYEVDNGDTVLGFKEWLTHKTESRVWTEHDAHGPDCAMRVSSSAECTCGKADYLARQAE